MGRAWGVVDLVVPWTLRRVACAIILVLGVGVVGAASAGAAPTGPSSAIRTPAALSGQLVAANAFVALPPARLMDTRRNQVTVDGRFAGVGAVTPAYSAPVEVLGRGGVPADGVAAVVVNITGIALSGPAVLSVLPNGSGPSGTSNLNLRAGQTAANLVVAPLSVGWVTVTSVSGASDVVLDVLGYYPTGPSFAAMTPARLLDTRPAGRTIDGRFSGLGAVGANRTLNLTVTGRDGIPTTGVAAVVLNLTGVAPTAATYITAYPAGQPRPNASTLNLAAGSTTPNLTIVKVGAGGQVALTNAAGAVHLIADVEGWIPTGPAYTPLTPARFLDTRPGGSTIDGLGAGGGPLTAGGSLDVRVAGRNGIPANATAVVVNLTAVAPTATTYVSAYPAGTPRPTASTLNVAAGEVRANLAVVKLGPTGAFTLVNARGSTPLLADVVGWFPEMPTITTASFPTATVGAPYAAPLDTADHRAGAWSVTAGALPPGLHLSGSSMLGTATARGPAHFALTFTDTAGLQTTAATGVLVNAAGPANGSWTGLATGDLHTCGVRTDGTVWCWGSNASGQLGDGSRLDSAAPVQVGTGTTWASIAVADSETCGVHTDGTAWCWGADTVGQLGDGTAPDRLVPVQVGTATTWAALTLGHMYMCGVRTDGTAWCWGKNQFGTLGNGTTTDSLVPVQVGTDRTWLTLAAGLVHTCGIRTDGTAWCWGAGGAGQLGDGSTGNILRLAPVRVTTGTSAAWTSVTLGFNHTCGVRTDGSAWCWGTNSDGEYGNGTTTSSAVPVSVGMVTTATTVTTWATLTASRFHTCGTRTDGTAWCWGGALWDGIPGHGPTSTTTVPVQVGTATNWATLSTGTDHTCGLRTDNTAWCWGFNTFGGLGDGTTTDSAAPVPVL